jgi:hypothetical protein
MSTPTTPSFSPDVTLERLLAALADRHDLPAWMVIRLSVGVSSASGSSGSSGG